MPLLDGGGSDTKDEGVVYIYNSTAFPFYRAEQYHQYHRNSVIGRALPSAYTSTARCEY